MLPPISAWQTFTCQSSLWKLRLKNITKTDFPLWVMLGHTGIFIMLVKPPKLKLRLFTVWEIFFHPSCYSDLYPDAVVILLSSLIPTHFSSPLLLLLPCFSCLYFPCLQLQQLMQKLAWLTLWLMAPSSDDWLPTPVLITPASFAIESSGNGTCGSLCNNMQQDREQHKNSPLVGLPMSEIFISDRRQESRE